MEIIFKNSYTRNRGLAKEIYQYLYFQRKWRVIIYIILALCCFANLLLAIFEEHYSSGVFVLTFLYVGFQFYCYSRQVNMMVRRDEEVHGKEIDVETIVTDSFIQHTASTGGVNKIEYDKIMRAFQTKNLILLHSKANLIYIFRKDTFEVGTKEAFIAFLGTKGITVKGR